MKPIHLNSEVAASSSTPITTGQSGYLLIRISFQGTLHDQQAYPFSEFDPCFRQQTDLLKSKRRVQSDRGDIHSTDAGNHGVTTFLLAFRDQLSQEHLAYPVTEHWIENQGHRILDRLTWREPLDNWSL